MMKSLRWVVNERIPKRCLSTFVLGDPQWLSVHKLQDALMFEMRGKKFGVGGWHLKYFRWTGSPPGVGIVYIYVYKRGMDVCAIYIYMLIYSVCVYIYIDQRVYPFHKNQYIDILWPTHFGQTGLDLFVWIVWVLAKFCTILPDCWNLVEDAFDRITIAEHQFELSPMEVCHSVSLVTSDLLNLEKQLKQTRNQLICGFHQGTADFERRRTHLTLRRVLRCSAAVQLRHLPGHAWQVGSGGIRNHWASAFWD